MIIQKIFHTYKEDFPLIKIFPQENRILFPVNFDPDNLFKNLILELSEFSNLPKYCYITRHTNDKIPDKFLTFFKERFSEFVNDEGEDSRFGIPTVWFVGHFQDYDSITEVRQKLDQKNLKYFDDGEEYNSFEQFNQAYWENSPDAEPFVKFLHQATMIGIDLLSAADYKQKLNQLGRLEYMRYTNIEDVKSDITEMEHYLRENSPYYKTHLIPNASEYKEFWENFTKWKTSEAGTGSWPHFLFNICGVQYPPTHPPLRVRPEELFEDWW